MTITLPYLATWQMLMDVMARVVTLRGDRELPIILSSLPELPERELGGPPVSFIHGPPGRNIAVAIGLRAARPHTPLLLIMNADGVTLGTNHLIHAARRNIGMTLLLLRSEVTEATERQPLDRLRWGAPGYQQSIEPMATPLEWATALQSALVGRGSLLDPDGLAALINEALETPGFSMIGVTAGANLKLGVLSRTQWPEYFTAYREWVASFVKLAREGGAGKAPSPKPVRAVPRYETLIAGVGGQGIKLAGTILSEAAGLCEGLWATHRGEYGSATRGGPSRVDVVFGSDPITYPGADRPDALIVLSQGAANRYAPLIKPNAHVVADPEPVSQMPPGALPVPIIQLAREYTGRPIAAGVVSLGCVAALSGIISLDCLRQSAARHVPRKALEKNLAALEAGYAATREALKGSSVEGDVR
ncbi:MAG TPA: 2-oxoacid:acceptor oxidoreductase family protein [Anaerolineales bacterium]|nr:2-oxoacid:acceptor oxidoreductase family protein [Anaerolineales bacterium]